MSDLEEALAFHIKAFKVQEPVRQYRFLPPRRWRFDFAWVEQQLAVEVEGGSWIYGAHNRGERFEGDCRKYNAAALLGWRVLRFTGLMIGDGTAIDTIRRALG